MIQRVSKLEQQYTSIDEKLNELIMQSAVKLQAVENNAGQQVLEYKHQIEVMNLKIAEVQKWQKWLIAVVVTIVAASGGSVATTALRAMVTNLHP